MFISPQTRPISPALFGSIQLGELDVERPLSVFCDELEPRITRNR
jgi:hypothetical protein